MRIHKLIINNIASLRGEHIVDFSKVHNDSSLFAITGKTGSGKSSILNSISLALYGQVYKQGSQNYDFVCLGESEASVEIQFSVKSQLYKSTWKLRVRKKSGEPLKKPQLTRTLFSISKTEQVALNKSIEEITGLNFDQFCKTSILNQGEFSRFLTSSFTERKDILEKFYDGEDLAHLNITLRSKIREIEKKIGEKNSVISSLKQNISEILISNDSINLQEKKFSSETKVYEIFQRSKTNIIDIKKALADLIRNKQLHQNNTDKLTLNTILKNDLNKTKSLYNSELLSAQNKLKTLKPQLDKCIKIETQLKSNQIQITRLNSDISRDKEKHEQTLSKKKEIDKQIKTQQEQAKKLEILYPWFKDDVVTQIEGLYNRVDKSHLSIKQFNNFKTELIAKQTDLTKSTTELSSKKKILESQVHELSLKIEKTDIQSLDDKTKKTESILSDFIFSLKEKNRLAEKKDSLQTKLNFTQTQLNDLSLKLEEIEGNYPITKRALDYHKLQSAINLCLQHSKSQNECIVCQSPMTPNGHKLGNDVDHEEFLSIQKKHEAQRMIRDEFLNKKAIQTSQIETQKEDIQEMSTQIKELEKFCVQETKGLTQNLLTPILSLENKEILSQELKLSQQSFNRHQQEQLSLDKLKEQLKQLDEKINYESKHKESLHNQIETIEKKIYIERQNIQSIAKECFIEELDIPLIIQKMKQVNLSAQSFIDISTKTSGAVKDLEYISNEIQRLYELIEQHIARKELTNSDIQTQKDYLELNSTGEPSKDLEILQENVNKNQKSLALHMEELRAVEISHVELHSKDANYKEQITGLELLIETVKTKLTNDIVTYGNIQPYPAEHHQKIIDYINKFKQVRPSEKFNVEILESSVTEFSAEFTKYEVYYKKLNSELTTNKTLLTEKNKYENKLKVLTENLQEITNEYGTLEQLNVLIGKDEFRNYVLSIIESQLITQTNKELKNLCNARYSIIQANKTNKMASEFKIVDHYNDALERKVSTLSGGETFLVSIAMAIALAELTRGNAQIDSLFIDEGFGTLDTDSIDEIFELLTTIQHSGKQIGIISHIQELTSRFPLSINLDKNTHGHSKIQLIYN